MGIQASYGGGVSSPRMQLIRGGLLPLGIARVLAFSLHGDGGLHVARLGGRWVSTTPVAITMMVPMHDIMMLMGSS